MEKNIPKLILRELRWMDLVVDSRQLIEKLIGALPAFSPSLQRDIIYILPEIASDEDSLVSVFNASSVCTLGLRMLVLLCAGRCGCALGPHPLGRWSCRVLH